MICPICHGQGTTGLYAAGGQPQRCGICGGSGQVVPIDAQDELRAECHRYCYQLVGLIVATSWCGTLNLHRWSEIKYAAKMAWSFGMALRLFESSDPKEGTP